MHHTQTTHSRRRSPRPRLRVGRIITLILAAALIILWACRPTVPELLLSTPARGPQLWARRLGYLVPKDAAFDSPRACVVEFWAWHATKQWAVRLPKANLEGWRPAPDVRAPWPGRAFALDASGRVAAVAVADGPRVHVISWQDGRRSGEVTLPVTPAGPLTGRDPFDLQATSDGRVFLWLRAAAVSPIWVIRGSVIRAVGQHRSRLPARAGYRRQLSPDGTLLIGYHPGARDGRLEYAQLRHQGDQLTVRHLRTLERFHQPTLFNGAVVARSGAVYGARGRVLPADDWRMAPEAAATPWCGIQYREKTARVLTPGTGASWGLPHPHPSWSVGVSPDGRYAVAFDRQARALPRAAGLDHRLQDLIAIFLAPRRMVLYRRPGTELATLTVPGARYLAEQVYLSPDGRYLLLRARERAMFGGRGMLLVYRVDEKMLQD